MNTQPENIWVITNFGNFVDQMMETPLKYLREDEYAIAQALAGLIVIVACVFFLAYVMHIFYYARKLRLQRIALIEALGAEVTADGLEKVPPILSSFLAHTWEKFEETLVKPTASNERVLNTVRPQAFFNSGEVGLNFRFYRALPGLFVGVGLLLTFFGLVAALDSALEAIQAPSDELNPTNDHLQESSNNTAQSTGADSEDAVSQNAGIEEMAPIESGIQNQDPLNALEGLLQSAKFKFYTSVAGLGASIVLSIAIRIGDKVIDRGFSHLAATLEGLFQLETVENLATQQLEVENKQYAELHRLNTEVAIAIGDQVEQALNKSLPTHLKPLGSKLDEFAQNLSGINTDALKGMAKSFASEIGSSTRELIDGMKQTLEQVSSTLNQLEKSIEPAISESVSSLRDAVESINSELNNASATHKRNLAELDEMLKRHSDNRQIELANMSNSMREQVAEIVDTTRAMSNNISEEITQSMNRFSNALRDASQEFYNHLEVIQQSIDSQAKLNQNLFEVEQSITRAAHNLNEAANPLIQVASEMNAASEKIQNSISSCTQTMSETAGKLSETAKLAISSWENYSSRFNKVDEDLRRLCNDLLVHLQHFQENSVGYIEKMDGGLANCVFRLTGVLDEICIKLDEYDIPKRPNSPQT